MTGSPLIQLHDFTLGQVHVRPAARAIESSRGCFVTEPLVMQLLVELSRKAGQVVTRREIFEYCWGAAPVGDDSLNRIVRELRKTLSLADGDTVLIETVPGAGYCLRLRANGTAAPRDVAEAVQEGLDSIRRGIPEPDYLRLEKVRRAAQLDRTSAAAWGMRALLSRYAAEYAEPAEIAELVADCQASAREALGIDPRQSYALVALATVAPIFGRWLEARSALERVLDDCPNEFVAEHELVIADMATGRVRAALERTNRLIDADPLAACLLYKGIYQRWSSGDLVGMDQLGDRGMHLWPTHAAIWTARFWTLAYTGRIEAAAAMLRDDAVRPHIPQPMLQLLKVVVAAVAEGSPASIDQAAATARDAAASGPARAIAALFALGLLDRVDDSFAVADAYYLRQGAGPVPLHSTKGELATNDLHRRVTQILFTPACAEMRQHPRFARLCDRSGLTSYWEQTGLAPDFLA